MHFVIAGLTRNLLRLEKIAGQARNDNAGFAYIFIKLLNKTAPVLLCAKPNQITEAYRKT